MTENIKKKVSNRVSENMELVAAAHVLSLAPGEISVTCYIAAATSSPLHSLKDLTIIVNCVLLLASDNCHKLCPLTAGTYNMNFSFRMANSCLSSAQFNVERMANSCYPKHSSV